MPVERELEAAKPITIVTGAGASDGNCESCSCDNSDSGECASGDSGSACPSAYLPRTGVLRGVPNRDEQPNT